MDRRGTYRNFNYRLEIDGVAVAYFSELAISGSAAQSAARGKGGHSKSALKLTGMNKSSDITMKRGLVGSALFLEWFGGGSGGAVADRARNVAIVLLDESGAEAERWTVPAARPVKYFPSDVNAADNETLIGLLELVNEGIERTR